jgi:hypothetical protein
MLRKRSFLFGRSLRRRTTLYFVRPASSPIPGPWVLEAIVFS